MRNGFRLTMLVTGLLLLFTLAACGDNSSAQDSESENGTDDIDLGDKDITIPYVAWADAEARTHLLTEVLEDVGYNVETPVVEAGPMFSSVADGSADIVPVFMLPTTHEQYWDEYQDDLTKANKVLDEEPLALTVPSYMDIDSIEDLKNNEELGEATDWTITGIDPGAGIMDSTEQVLDEYGLDNWELQQSSEEAMLSQLEQAYDNKEPIIVTGWQPHWMFVEWDLEMLEDPDNVYGSDEVYVAARNDLEDDSPAAYQVLEQYTEDFEQINGLISDIHDGEDPQEAAEQFIENHPDKIEEWEEGVATK